MEVTFWGVRGSYPTPHPRTLRYGGNTPCVEVQTPAGHTIILDCGTGITRLGERLSAGTPPDGLRLPVLLSHLHWDHIHGLPFFAPLYDERNQVSFYCRETEGMAAGEALQNLMQPPFFPVSPAVLRSRQTFYAIGEETFRLFDVQVVSRLLNHPQGCLGFRIEAETGVFVYATDHEHGDSRCDRNVRELAEGADVLVYDAQYTPEEYSAHAGWGHSTWEEAVRVAHDVGARNLVLFHHDPAHSDLFLDSTLIEACEQFPRAQLATERVTLRVAKRRRLEAPAAAAPPRIPAASTFHCGLRNADCGLSFSATLASRRAGSLS